MAREVTFTVFWVVMSYGLVQTYRWFRAELTDMQHLTKVFAVLSHLNSFSDVVTGISRTWGKCEYGTIIQLTKYILYFKVCSCIYRICSDRTWGKYEYGTILHLIIQVIYFKGCSCVHRISSDRTWGIYESGNLYRWQKYIQTVK